MNLEQARYNLTKLTRKRKALLIVDALLWSLAAFSIAVVCMVIFTDSMGWRISASVILGSVVFLTRAYMIGIFTFDEINLVKLINQHYKQYQESADLLLNTSDLNTLQQIQQTRTLSEFSKSYQAIVFPNKLAQATIVFLAGIVLSGVISFLIPADKMKEAMNDSANTSNQIETKLPASIKTVTLQVTPPVYTGLKRFNSEKLNITIPEGSTIDWSVAFSDDINRPHIQFAAGDSLPLKSQQSKTYSAQRMGSESFIYQFTWRDKQNNKYTSDYFKIEVTKDQPPSIAIHNLPQFSELSLADQSVVNLTCNLADDYGLDKSHIIATVSKGSGEAIKFREEKLFFSKPDKISGKSVQATRVIDLKKLGMEPGDELYFYIEAFDTKVPAPNRSRTETYFIALSDTASNEISTDAGLGVDLMPEYFRSQRQIIIDTEKLLRNKKKITAREFKRTSNELGYDQKVLRLKYGEFLGEEFESGVGSQSGIPDDAAETIEDAVKQYGHTHDTENEHNLVEDKKPGQKEEHHHEDGKEESPLEAFAHNHDNSEEATFFVLSVRAKLKAALAVMWEAELYLRVIDPKKSLPFQYQALRLLKEISNDSRVYVHRTGFDPPPIKEDIRLKGDLSETKSTTDRYTQSNQEKFPAIRKALQEVETLLSKPKITITSSSKLLLQQAGNELARVALEKPGEYLKSLSLLQELVQGKVTEDKTRQSLTQIRKTLWKIVPPQPASPNANTETLHQLDRQFIENLMYD